MGFNFERYFRNDETGHLGFPSEGLEVQQQYFIIIWPAKFAFREHKSFFYFMNRKGRLKF